jgi:hypothetical protein
VPFWVHPSTHGPLEDIEDPTVAGTFGDFLLLLKHSGNVVKDAVALIFQNLVVL